MTILGIETSCDETALALIETRGKADDLEVRVIDSLVHSQAELHNAYGGVYPTLAKREHGKNLIPLLHKLISGITDKNAEAQKTIPREHFTSTLASFENDVGRQNPDLFESFKGAEEFLSKVPRIDRVAVTEGPGLEPALWVGINCARMLSSLWKIPLQAVNHMEGHLVGSLLDGKIPYGTWQKPTRLPRPAVALLVSGGHTEIVEVMDIGKYKILGRTRDDAVGEAFDKVARLLGLPYPGGPHISMLAREAEEKHITSPLKLPRPMLKSGDLDFSFAGLKTAVLYAVRKASGEGALDGDWKKGLAYEFEQSVIEVLESKLRLAIGSMGAKSIILGGGVSANIALRERLEKTANEFSIPIFMPSRHISGDNALMIALASAWNGENLVEETGIRAEGTKKLGVDKV